MSPRALLIDGYDFYFFSNEEERMHVHVDKGEDEAKVWIEPKIELAENHGFSPREIKFILKTIEEHERAIRKKWNDHFNIKR